MEQVEIEEQQVAETIEEQNIKSLWTALRVAEKQTERRGLQFGQAMYEYREKHAAQGRRTDRVTHPCNTVTKLETFEEFCDRLGIVRMTAYRWIAKYEQSIGARLLKPTPYNRPANLYAESKSENSSEADAESPVGQVDLCAGPTTADEDAALLKSESTPAATLTPVLATEDKHREQLGYLVKRLKSLSEALQQVVDDKAKWSAYAEYAEVLSIGKKIAGLVELLCPEGLQK